MEDLRHAISDIGVIVVAMAALAAVEVVVPLRARGSWSRAHLVPNAALTLLTFAMNAVLAGALVVALDAARGCCLGLLSVAALPRAARALVVLLALDLSFYLAHSSMHRVPWLWRFHRVHHSDPAVDVTTTIRQHPGETLVRYAFTAALALPLGATSEEFLLYRSAIAIFGLLEHANLRVPEWLDAALSLVFTWPAVHKGHHSRDPRLADTNYGNLVCWWDRAFGTFTPARAGRAVSYGLDGLDDAATQTTVGLLRLPFRAERAGSLDRGRSPTSRPA